ncbi:MAG: Y-family DNA polymerase [Gammaproteobacteria bacterium]|nr:Y-family DNA polymerase [Gammaproteobacteria bacterium]
MRRIAHIDVNAFYCSCERLFRPDLAERPIVVLSNGDGCVVARDAMVKRLGVPMGQPWFEMKRFAGKHGIVAFSSNYTFYGDMSRRVMDVLGRFSPDQEIYSIDESFLDLTPQPRLSGAVVGQAIRGRVRRWTGLPVCVGIGRTKTEAKLADWIAKHDPALGGVCDLAAMNGIERRDRETAIEVREVWGVGRRLAERLRNLGIFTVADLAAADPRHLRAHFSVMLERTARELRGEACLELDEVPPPRRQIVASRTFSAPVYTPGEMAESMRTYMGRAAARMRAQGSVAGAVGVWIETNRFRTHEAQHNGSATIPLPAPSDDEAVLTAWAVELMRRIFRPGCRYWKSGVMLLDLIPRGSEQRLLFDAPLPETEARRHRAMQTLDAVNGKWGRGTLGLGSAGLRGPRHWSMKRELLSPRYTTSWRELPVARA